MSKKMGPIRYGSDNNEVFIGRDMGHVKNYSDQTASEIDDEIKGIIYEGYRKTEELLKKHEDQLHLVANYLIENEKISGEQFVKLIGGEENSFDAETE